MKKRAAYPHGNAMVFPLELTQLRREPETLDLKYLYPAETAGLSSMVATVCDQMEYDGSPMYDCYPDKVTVSRMADGICCHYCKGRDHVPQGWLKPMVEIMLCQEMGCRREKRRCHKQRYYGDAGES